MLLWSAPPPARTPSCVASTPNEESGAAPAGVAKLATGTAPVSAETTRRRRRSIFMSGSDREFGADSSSPGPEKTCRDGTDQADQGSVNAAGVSQWERGARVSAASAYRYRPGRSARLAPWRPQTA